MSTLHNSETFRLLQTKSSFIIFVCQIIKKKHSWRTYLTINKSYLTDSYIIFTLKMESVPKITNFGPKNDGESGLDFF